MSGTRRTMNGMVLVALSGLPLVDADWRVVVPLLTISFLIGFFKPII